ncbi:hypothetical protein MRAB57_5345 [Mycobacterium rhizamassiliense]|jgi:hypothetical protein|uniref:Transmembrane protein n=1 Tax=Mycobacterium rhizamassiliense TaxID=1841860 RepID=A0A2U3P186_9MYCO|nr:hypothetical protein [Mycobacterium rhizamassiliense]SPM37498.1 hypothetical protein MRAB57_5345 [Mycobacterium rhizamassiliense]
MPEQQRSTADIVATALLFVAQLTASGLAFVLTIMGSAMPSCGVNCDSSATSHFVHNTWIGTLIVVSGVGIALLVAACGTLVSGLRATRMWKWPAFGLAIVIVCGVVAEGLRASALSGAG